MSRVETLEKKEENKLAEISVICRLIGHGPRALTPRRDYRDDCMLVLCLFCMCVSRIAFLFMKVFYGGHQVMLAFHATDVNPFGCHGAVASGSMRSLHRTGLQLNIKIYQCLVSYL